MPLTMKRGPPTKVISTRTLDPAVLVEKARKLPGLTGRDLVREVTCAAPYDWDEGEWELLPGQTLPRPPSGQNCRVVAYDFGIKQNILRKLVQAGCQVRVVPASTTAAEILEDRPDGVFLSNGPGDPAAVSYAIENVRNLIGRVPIFGICLGHQILSLALGAGSYKLRFGHHGGNQPVMDLATRKDEITSQNHGFAVDTQSLDAGKIEVTHINLNDDTLEGFRHKELPVLAVQYHPEASPGPHDARYLFDEFKRLIKETK
jgi:carbamoyl-phosphate synthase small subunit